MHFFQIWSHLRSPPLDIPSLALYSSFENTEISPTHPRLVPLQLPYSP